MKKIRAAVIGCGNISVMHLDSINALENIQLVGVCDIREERAQAAAEKYNTTAYTDYKELFERKSLTLYIFVCLIICIYP